MRIARHFSDGSGHTCEGCTPPRAAAAHDIAYDMPRRHSLDAYRHFKAFDQGCNEALKEHRYDDAERLVDPLEASQDHWLAVNDAYQRSIRP